MFNECFWKLFVHQFFKKLIHMFQWYIMNLKILKNLIFSRPNKLLFLNVKNKTLVTFVAIHVNVIMPLFKENVFRTQNKNEG